MNKHNSKQTLRKHMLQLRERMDDIARKIAEKNICEHYIAANWFDQIERECEDPALFCYMPYRFEVDIIPVIEWAWRRGWRVAIPKIDLSSKMMSAYWIKRMTDVSIGAYGIREPKLSNALMQASEQLHVIIVPGLAFDRRGARLGYGGGYYDRYCEQYARRHGHMPLLTAPAFAFQLVEEVPSEHHDIVMNQIVTEHGQAMRMELS